MEFKEGMKWVFDKVTFKENTRADEYPEETEGTGALKMESNYNDYKASPTDSDKILRFADKASKAKLRFYKLKGGDWLDVVRKATQDFKDGCSVMINTEDANKDSVTRMLDFMGGVAFSHGGRLVRQGTMTHAVIPENCEVGGDDVGGDIYDSIDGYGGSAFE
ncbi:MAG: cell division protein SepF [Oscillospiraceae bacterium]|nr:cell division protein SepF [Oscillospiraceae bacterium]